MNPEILINALGPSSMALVVFYFYWQSKVEANERIEKLEAKIERLEKEQDATLERLISFYEGHQTTRKKEPESADSGS